MKHYSYYDRDGGCPWNRLLLPARYLKSDFPQHRFDVSVTDPDLDYDVFSVHGLMHLKSIERFGYWKSKGKRCVWSIDDLMTEVPSWNPCKPSDDVLSSWYLTREVADVILCSTPHLAEQIGKSEKVVVAQNLIDLDSYRTDTPADETDVLVIAWSGSKTHRGDLEILCPVIDHILDKYRGKVEFAFVGYAHPDTLRDHLHRGVIFQEGTPLSLYPRVMEAVRPHLWLSPLADVPFNYSKSGIRPLEGFALSAAVIASPVGEYAVVRDGIDGLHARTTDDWISAIELLIRDRDYSRKLAVAGRQRVEEIGDWRNPECRKSAGWHSYIHRLEDLTAGNAIAA